MSISCQQTIEDRISASEYGTVFITSDFSDVTSFDSANRILIRLADNGKLRRIIRGVYDKPEFNDFLGEYVAPSPDNVAKGIARNFRWTIVPCGETALNILELSTQVPAVWLYVSDGTYKKYSFGKTIIQFKRTTNKEISKLSYKTALVIQALKALGKENIDNVIISKISKKLTPNEKQQMLVEAKFTTAWVYEYLKLISQKEGNK